MPPKKTPVSRAAPQASRTAASAARQPIKPATGRGTTKTPARGSVPGTRSQPVTSRPGAGVKKATPGGPSKPGGKVPAAASKTGSKSQQNKGGEAPAKKPSQTKEDLMARKIQTAYRGYRCRKQLLILRKKKKEYEELMDKLQRDAYLQMVKLEQERAEQQYRREEEERRKKREQTKRVKKMLEAAFDGETGEIKCLLSEVSALYMDSDEAVVARYQHKLVECTDPNNNTPLSEAAAGGDPDTIRLLISLGADPNTKGQFGRTPLYRAAFAGHIDAVKVLLECGADPRGLADDGATPEQVAANPSVEEWLKGWEIETTNKLLASLEDQKTKRLERDTKLRQVEESKIQNEIVEVEKDNSAKQKQLNKAYEELNKRIFEHDTYGAEKGDITLPAVHDAEEHLEMCKIHAEEARKKLQQIRLKLRMKKKEFQELGDEEDEDLAADVVINIRELDDVLIRDVGNKIATSDKWPLIIDANQQAATFLRYRDTNYLNVCSPRNMETDTIRMALLGAIRYGKFAVIDLMDLEDSWRSLEQRFDTVQKNLLSELMSKQLMKGEKYLSLVKKSDGPEYSPKMFQSACTHNFKFVIVTQLIHPPEELLQQCYTIRIHTPNM